MNVPTWVWILTIGVTTAILLFDVFIIGRRPHVPSNKEIGVRARGLRRAGGPVRPRRGWSLRRRREFATEYYAGWLTEYSLSVDNLFVFLIIMAKFGVPEKLQQSALMVGIVIALVLRGIFIAVGAAAINQFSWVFYLFGAFLIYTAVKLAREGEQRRRRVRGEPLPEVGGARASRPPTSGTAPSSSPRRTASRLITPMFIVILALGTTDLLFALDSIPAIYGLTQEPFLVLTANIFALMGLRQLYFLHRRPAQAAGLPRHRPRGPARASSASSWSCTPCTRTSCRSSTAASPSTGRRTSHRRSRSASSSASWPSPPSPAWSRPARTSGPRSAADHRPAPQCRSGPVRGAGQRSRRAHVRGDPGVPGSPSRGAGRHHAGQAEQLRPGQRAGRARPGRQAAATAAPGSAGRRTPGRSAGAARSAPASRAAPTTAARCRRRARARPS